jgi:hypothetical protein
MKKGRNEKKLERQKFRVWLITLLL